MKKLCLAQARDRRPDRVHRVDSCVKKSGKTTLNGAAFGWRFTQEVRK